MNVRLTVLSFLGPSSSMKNTDCQVPKSSFPLEIGIVSLEDNKNDFRWDLALLSIKSCCQEYLSETKSFNINSKSAKRPLSFSFTAIADVECFEKIFTIPSLISIFSLIFEVISMISKFLFEFIVT